MPLEKFQKGLRLCESVSLGAIQLPINDQK